MPEAPEQGVPRRVTRDRAERALFLMLSRIFLTVIFKAYPSTSPILSLSVGFLDLLATRHTSRELGVRGEKEDFRMRTGEKIAAEGCGGRLGASGPRIWDGNEESVREEDPRRTEEGGGGRQ